MRRFIAIITAFALFAPSAASAAFDPNAIISDREFTNTHSMSLKQINTFLMRGFLGSYSTLDWEGVRRGAGEIIYNAANDAGISPKVLLVTLQKEQSLITSENPSQNRLDWAMGYGVCDDCSKSDPAIQRWKGFGKQVNSTALQFAEGYLADIASVGSTLGKYGPGIEVEVSGETLVPENAATAALYAYTPHISGNRLFYTLWNQWFSTTYPSGTLLKADGNPDVYLIERGVRRHITNWSAFVSRFNPNLIVTVSQSALDSFEEGTDISFPNYSLFEDENGQKYLLVDQRIRPFASDNAFYRLGFKDDELVEVTADELAQFTIGTEISETEQAARGAIYELPNGAQFFVEAGKRHFIPAPEVAAARYRTLSPVLVDPNVLGSFQEGPVITFPDGSLLEDAETGARYFVSEGDIRLIPSDEIFEAYGWNASEIINTSEKALKFHDHGDDLEAPSFLE